MLCEPDVLIFDRVAVESGNIWNLIKALYRSGCDKKERENEENISPVS